MKNNDFEKYISDLSPELQEKARQCKDMDELNKLLAENDVELSEDALAAVAGGGGCSLSDDEYDQGDITRWKCPECGNMLLYWDRLWLNEDIGYQADRLYCDNSACPSFNNGLWVGELNGSVHKYRG